MTVPDDGGLVNRLAERFDKASRSFLTHLERAARLCAFLAAAALAGCGGAADEAESSADCLRVVSDGFRPIAADRDRRFLGKVEEATASCRGGVSAVEYRSTPWVDWPRYWGAGDARSLGRAGTTQTRRGLDGALLDLEYQRIELIEFNLFDNRTYEEYVEGRGGFAGPSLKVWPAMRLPRGHPRYRDVGGDGEQLCRGELIRHRTLTGICNDIRNPAMGSTGQEFGRMVEFEATFPDRGGDVLARNRHGDRLGLLKPDPQLISRVLFTREAQADYRKADTFNVLAAFWIQFMTHDWFSHVEDGHNGAEMMPTGCRSKRVDGAEQPLGPEEVARLGCRPDDRMESALVADASEPRRFDQGGKPRLARAYRTTRNMVTAWWDASQIYGYDETSRRRVKRDPADRARLLLVQGTAGAPGLPVAPAASGGPDGRQGTLPEFGPGDPIHPAWAGQEAAAFPDNWNIGLSFFHNVFAREHNAFVDAFRKEAARATDADSGLRDPARPDRAIRYGDVTPDELFEVARLVVAAEIAKIHTLEWTTQLLYDEPLYLGMHANWSGLLGGHQDVAAALGHIVTTLGDSRQVKKANRWYSVFASGPGIFGLGSRAYEDDSLFAAFDRNKRDVWDLRNPDHINGGTNHFGAPFNFPEEFVTVYRLHPLVPDLIEYREARGDPNLIRKRVPVVGTFRGLATAAMRSGGLADWALSMGRQRCGALTLRNHPHFLQDLPMPRLKTATNLLDVPALDILRDRERGVPRFNELRRQLGLRQLAGFDDFIDTRLPPTDPERGRQEDLARSLRAIYGRHTCDASKIITGAQRNADDSPIDDCLGHPNGSLVDNIEDVDAVVGWLAEAVRPHGFAISETQFQVFILNASRRLFSDRFFTSSFRPEFYSAFGVRWVEDNGPGGKVMETGALNGHAQEVSPLKRVLLRTIPGLAPELKPVMNVFDPWARDRGEYYSLAWKPRRGAESDEAFRP